MWRTGTFARGPPYAVKILDAEGKEANLYDELHSLSDSGQNHTLPCDVIRSEPPILVMPCIPMSMIVCNRWGLEGLLEFFHQVLEVLYPRALHARHTRTQPQWRW